MLILVILVKTYMWIPKYRVRTPAGARVRTRVTGLEPGLDLGLEPRLELGLEIETGDQDVAL